VCIEFFEHDHGQEDVVLFETEQTGGVVQQHIGVEDKKFARAGHSFACRSCALRRTRRAFLYIVDCQRSNWWGR
jgi:hypothetical protein